MTYDRICAVSGPCGAELMTLAWICAIGWLSESPHSRRAPRGAGCSYHLMRYRVGAVRGAGAKAGASTQLTGFQRCLRWSCGSDSAVLTYRELLSPLLRLFSMKTGILTHIDVLIVPSMSLHFPSCFLRIMERKLTALTSSAESLDVCGARPIPIHCTGTRQGLRLLHWQRSADAAFVGRK